MEPCPQSPATDASEIGVQTPYSAFADVANRGERYLPRLSVTDLCGGYKPDSTLC